MNSSHDLSDEATGLATTVFSLAQRTVGLYAGWASALRRRGQTDTAELLQNFSTEAEELRDDCLGRLRRIDAASAPAPNDPRFAAAGQPFLSDPEVEELDAQIASRYQILAAVVRVEDMAFRALSHFSATSTDPSVRALAEAMAQVQLSRTARLRRQRRAAYRRALPGPRTPQLPLPSLVATEADLVHAACAIETEAIESIGKAADLHSGLVALLAKIEDGLKPLTERAARLEPPNKALADALRDHAERSQGEETPAASLLANALSDSKRAFAFYDGVMTQAADETLMLLAQNLSEGALARLRTLSEEQGQ